MSKDQVTENSRADSPEVLRKELSDLLSPNDSNPWWNCSGGDDQTGWLEVSNPGYEPGLNGLREHLKGFYEKNGYETRDKTTPDETYKFAVGLYIKKGDENNFIRIRDQGNHYSVWIYETYKDAEMEKSKRAPAMKD